jgi:glycerophosphoryl diester phosphodiesterase
VTRTEPSFARTDVSDAASTLVCAHRGASRHLPDNSLESFEAAIASGADLIETDVRADRGGGLMLAHGRVRIAATRAGRHGRPPARSSARIRVRTAARIVPEPIALQGLLDVSAGRIGLDLEIKQGRVVPALLDAIAGWTGRLVLTSFDPAAIRVVRERDPSRFTGLIAGPMHIGDPVANALACDAHAVVLSERRATPKVLADGRLPIWVWTVNHPARLQRWLSEPAVSCVITDDPGTAVSVRGDLGA